MEQLLLMTMAVALLAAFVVLLIKKWGIAELIQIHGNDFLSKLFSCDLCMSFWAGVLVTMIVCLVSKEMGFILIPVMSTPITRMLV